MRLARYRRTICWYDSDDDGNTVEVRAEFRPMQYAIGLSVHDALNPGEIVIEVILPFASVTLAFNELPF